MAQKDEFSYLEEVSGLATEPVAEHGTVAEARAENVLTRVSASVLREPLHEVSCKLNVIDVRLHGGAAAAARAGVPGAGVARVESAAILAALLVAVIGAARVCGPWGCSKGNDSVPPIALSCLSHSRQLVLVVWRLCESMPVDDHRHLRRRSGQRAGHH
jgi:hypothetical protein